MYFSEITKPGIDAKRQPNVNTNDLHQFMWTLFHPMPKIRNFLYTLYNGKIYVVSVQKPRALNGDSDLKIRVNNYNPEFSKGQPLRFDVRLALQVRRNSDGKKVPLIYAYREKLGDCNQNWNSLMHGALSEWFGNYSTKYGFRVRDFYVNGYHYYDFKKEGNGKKKNNDNGVNVHFNSMDVQGVLEVVGPKVFTNTLHRGIGKARCYGCGLMLVAP